jgi:hypothetical protein
MIYENEEKDAIYRKFDGDLDELTDHLKEFCAEIYGDRCEFYTVSVEREKDGGSWKVHEFRVLKDEAVKAVKNHLNARKDLVRVRFGDVNRDYDVEFIICPVRNTGSLSRFVRKDDLEDFGEDSLVVVAVENTELDEDEHRKFLESLGE